MAATTWVPKPRSGRHWLLSNGKTVEAPQIEETSTGRKVRIAGTATSVFSGDEESLIRTYVENEAKRQRARVITPMDTNNGLNQFSNSYSHGMKPHFVGGNGWGGQTVAWWRFRHATLPIEVVVEVEIHGLYAGGNRTSPQSVSGKVRIPMLHPERAWDGGWLQSYSADEAIDDLYGMVTEGDTELKQFHVREPLTWLIDPALSDDRRHESVRPAVQDFLRRIRIVEEIDSLAIPDMRSPKKPAYLTLQLVDTNVTGAVVEELRDFLDTGPAMARAVNAYREMQSALKDLGLVLDDKRTDDLLSALQAGAEALTVGAGNPAALNDVDTAHSLTLRLATGTFIVHCNHRAQAANPDVIAEKWEEAHTIASLTGQEPLLMGFARAYAEQSEQIRAQEILDSQS